MGVTWLGLLQLQEEWIVRVDTGTCQNLVRLSVSRDGTQEPASAWNNRVLTEKKRRVGDTGDTFLMGRDAQSANLPW